MWTMRRMNASPYAPAPLPIAGGIGDQPAALMDALLMLDGMTIEQ